MTRQEAEVFAEFRNKKLWRMFGNWLVFEMNENKTINFVHVGNYHTNYGLAFLGRNGELQFPNDDAVVPPKAMLEAIRNRLYREE